MFGFGFPFMPRMGGGQFGGFNWMSPWGASFMPLRQPSWQQPMPPLNMPGILGQAGQIKAAQPTGTQNLAPNLGPMLQGPGQYQRQPGFMPGSMPGQFQGQPPGPPGAQGYMPGQYGQFQGRPNMGPGQYQRQPGFLPGPMMWGR